jgi:outer membrane protein
MRNAIFAAGAVLLAAPAAAQDAAVDTAPPPAQQASALSGDYLAVGIGVGYEPSYIGSDDYVLFPVGVVQGSLHGIGISSRSTGVALDFIPDKPGKIGLNLGVAANLRLNRTRKTHDPVVDRLGKLDRAFELGPTIGITIPQVFDQYDSLSIGTDIVWDVSGKFDGMELYPHISYQTPLSRGLLANVSVNADYGDDNFADYYFSVSPAGAAASGLPVFKAKGGFNQVGTTLFLGVDLDGDLTNGGPALFFAGGYTRVLGDAKRSPITSIRGSADQWYLGAGLGWTF